MLVTKEIRAIYNKGVEAVATTIKQLHKMIETNDEREQKLINIAASTHLKKIDQLTSRIARLEE